MNKGKNKKLASDLSLIKTSHKDLKKEVSELKKRVKKLEKPKKGVSEATLRRAFFWSSVLGVASATITIINIVANWVKK